MNIARNTVLITGGGSGIGLALAKRLLEKNNRVIICGRDEERLKRAKQSFSDLSIIPCDITKADEREQLARNIRKFYPDLNILINNAAVQTHLNLTSGQSNFRDTDIQIETNFTAAVKLIGLFYPLLEDKAQSAIINVTSDLAFVPMALAPVYCATKAALHSFTVSLRYQFRHTHVKVFEVIPPVTDTQLDKLDLKKASPEYVADKIIAGISKNRREIRVGKAKLIYAMSRVSPWLIHFLLNKAVEKANRGKKKNR